MDGRLHQSEEGLSHPRKFFEDCHVGDRVITSGRTITETDVVMFAALTGDWHPLHTDAEYARTGPYGERIVHGMLSLVTGLNLLFRHGGFGNGLLPESVVALTGIDRVKFKAPVKIGDTVHLECDIAEKSRVFKQRGQLVVGFWVRNQHQEDVLSGRMSVLAECREGN